MLSVLTDNRSFAQIGSHMTGSTTTLRLVDDKLVSAKDIHSNPRWLKAGETVTLGGIKSIDILYATTHHKRLDFVTTEDDMCSTISVSVRSMKRGVPGTLVCTADLPRSSSVQLEAPADTIAVMEINVGIGEAILICQRTGLARVTCVTEEAVGDDDIWVTSLVFESVTSHWDSDTPNYKINQLVPVRLPAHGGLIAM